MLEVEGLSFETFFSVSIDGRKGSTLGLASSTGRVREALEGSEVWEQVCFTPEPTHCLVGWEGTCQWVTLLAPVGLSLGHSDSPNLGVCFGKGGS